MKNTAETVKEIIKQLNAAEQESVKNELLGWLLFSDVRNESASKFTDLTDHEKELIKKLAGQAEALRKLMRDDD
jgi:hypothetical protein